MAALAEPLHPPAAAGGGAATAGGGGGGVAGGSEAAGGAPVLLFAGEACHAKYIGTMHGAAITGEAAAAQLLSAWRQEGRC